MRRYNIWWDKEAETEQREVNKLYRLKMRLTNSFYKDQMLEEYGLRKINYQKLIKQKKIDSWKRFLGEQTMDDVWSLNKILFKKMQRQAPATITINGENTTDNRDTVKGIEYHFFPNAPIEDETEQQKQIRAYSKELPETENASEFKEWELDAVATSFSKKKSPGHDHLDAEFCSKIIIENKDYFKTLYSLCLKLEYFPKTWKVAIVKVIPKPNQNDYTKIESYTQSILGTVLTLFL